MEYRKEIINLYNSDEYQRLKAYYSKRSTLDILGVARSELAHSNMLAWLLDPSETHGLGLFPIRKFLHLLVLAKLELVVNSTEKGKAEFDQGLLDAILTNSCEVEGAIVEAEKSVDSTGDRHKDSRIDIYVEVRLRLQKNDRHVRTLPIVIENKIDSKEHDNQTESYYKWVNDYVGSSGNGFIKPLSVFLTRQRTLTLNGVGNYGDVSCSCEKYIRINYQYIVDHLLEQCLKQDLSEDVRRILKDYIRSLTYTYIKGDINEGGSYMAIGKEERELLARFWDNNKNLLSAVLVAVTQDTEGDMTEEDRRNVEKAVASLSKRDYTKYAVEGYDEVFAKNRMVLAVVQKYCREHRDITYDKLKAAFPNKLQGSFGVVMREDERRGKLDGPVKRYFEGENERIRLSDGSLMFVSSEWGKDNIPAFIRRAKELGIIVTVVPTKS